MDPTADGLEALSDDNVELTIGEAAPPALNGHDRARAAPDEPLDLRQMLKALQAVRVGDFSVRLPADQAGISGKIADAFNEICLLYTSDAADDLLCVDLGGRRI